MYCYFWLSWCLIHLTTATVEDNAEKRLLDKLFRYYDKRVRPLQASNESVEVELQYWLVNINDLNERLQQLETVGWIQMEWKDEFLTWNPAEFDGLRYVVVSLSDIWHPDIVIRNRYWTSVDKGYGDILDYDTFRTMVYHDGAISFTTSGRIVTSCPIDLTYFPFDTQTCFIHLDSWTYSNPQVILNNLSSTINLNLYHKNGQWTLLDTIVTKEEEDADGETYIELKFFVQLKRKPAYYGTTLVIPCAMMSVMVVVVFVLPADADEKISLSATMLLSYSVFQLLIVNIMPQTSDYTPIMTIYLLTVMIIAALSLFSTVIVLRLYHNTSNPPDWLHNLTFTYLARLTCMKSLASNHSARNLDPSQSTSITTLGPDVTADHNTEAMSSSIVDAILSEKCICTHVEGAPMEDLNDFELNLQQAMKAIGSLTRCINAKMETRALQHRNEELWHDIAHVFDRVFFIVYLTMTFIACAVLLGIYPQTGRNTAESIDIDKEISYSIE